MILDAALVFGALVSIITIAIQALATILVIRVGHVAARLLPKRRRIATLIVVMAGAGTLLSFGHFLEVAVWAEFYDLLGVIPRPDAYYLAYVNFTTLGYGDIVPVYEWRLLGPITAANGMLLFGWSTAVLFAVLSRALTFLRLE